MMILSTTHIFTYLFERYIKKTKEEESDREESIFFSEMKSKTAAWLQAEKDLEEYANVDCYPDDMVDPDSLSSEFSDSDDYHPAKLGAFSGLGAYFGDGVEWDFPSSENETEDETED